MSLTSFLNRVRRLLKWQRGPRRSHKPPRRLELDCLEDRITPATVAWNMGLLKYEGGAVDNNLSIQYFGGAINMYVLSDPSANIFKAGAPDPGFTGLGSHEVGIPAASVVAIYVELGSGSDDVHVMGTQAPLWLYGGSQGDWFRVDLAADNPQVRVYGDGGQDVLEVRDLTDSGEHTVAIGDKSVDHVLADPIDYQSIETVDYYGHDTADDWVGVLSTHSGARTTVYLGGGNDSVEVGENWFVDGNLGYSLNGINGELVLVNHEGSDTLSIRDQVAFASTYTLQGSCFQRTGDPWIYFGSAFGTVNLQTGPNNDVINLYAAGERSTTVNAGGGHDTINVHSLWAGGTATVNAGDGDDTIHVSPTSGQLGYVVGDDLTLNGGDGANSLFVSDQSFGYETSYSIYSDQLSRIDSALIHYSDFNAGVTLHAGWGTSTIEVNSTHAWKTTVNSGSGPDTVNVWATTGPLTVSAGEGNDTINTFNTLDSIAGGLTVHGGTGTDALNLHDEWTYPGTSYTVSPFCLSRSGWANPAWLSELENIVLNAGPGDDFVTMTGYSTLTAVAVNGGGGNDTLQGGIFASQSRFVVSGLNAGTLQAAGSSFTANVATFSSFENLRSGGGPTTFVLHKGQGVTGYLQGTNGPDTLDLSAYTSDVVVNLALMTATGAGSISSIDHVIGGSGNDILVGNDGNNQLWGGRGRDLLIGGGSGLTGLSDTLDGGPGEDILIAGFTAYDTDPAALNAIRAEWTRTDLKYDGRVRNLTSGTGVPVLDKTTVFSNQAAAGNTLTGRPSDRDLFFARLALDMTDWDGLTETLVKLK